MQCEIQAHRHTRGFKALGTHITCLTDKKMTCLVLMLIFRKKQILTEFRNTLLEDLKIEVKLHFIMYKYVLFIVQKCVLSHCAGSDIFLLSRHVCLWQTHFSVVVLEQKDWSK